jgi:NAD(P)-dependent dehydrogenase (short-subunit alcohol dehydrogenase family)
MSSVPSVVVTGVSTGIGRSIARVMVKKGFHVYGSVRRQIDADSLSAELGDRFTPLIFDITDASTVLASAQFVREQLQGNSLLGLVNNAGVAVPGPLLHIPLDEFRHQMEVNLTGPLIVTQAFTSLLGATHDFQGNPGRIVMISSVGGRMAFPFQGPYVASKFALEGLSDTLRIELMLYGVDVISIEPGPIATPIWDKGEQIDAAYYAETDYAPILGGYQKYMIAEGRKGLPPDDVGQLVHHVLTTPHPRIRYPILRGQFLNYTLPRQLPSRFVNRFIAGRLHLQRKK